MARVYEHEELLRLKESPLVPEKPANLPPIEEWMGPPPARSARAPSRGNLDPVERSDAFPMRRQGHADEAIEGEDNRDQQTFGSVSPGRTLQRYGAGRGSENITGTGLSNGREWGGRMDHWHSLGDRKGLRSNTGQNDPSTNRTTRWQQDRNGPSEISDPNGPDPSHNRAKWDASNGENADRRRVPLRSREVASWVRGAGPSESTSRADDDDRPSRRSQARGGAQSSSYPSRQNRHQATRDEEEPEWANVDIEPHTEFAPAAATSQADFETWRAQQKAQRDGRPGSGDPNSILDVSAIDLNPNGRGGTRTSQQAVSAPFLDIDAKEDGFFDLLSRKGVGSKIENSQEPTAPQTNSLQPSKTGKSSKFSNLFGPGQVAPGVIPPPTHVPQRASESQEDEDRAGFQRILNLLGQKPPTTQLNNSSQQHQYTPPVLNPSFAETSKPPPGPYPKSLAARSDSSQNVNPLDNEFLLKLMQSSPQSKQPNYTPSERQSMPRSHSQMHPSHAPPPTDYAHASHRPPPGMAYPPGLMNSRHAEDPRHLPQNIRLPHDLHNFQPPPAGVPPFQNQSKEVQAATGQSSSLNLNHLRPSYDAPRDGRDFPGPPLPPGLRPSQEYLLSGPNPPNPSSIPSRHPPLYDSGPVRSGMVSAPPGLAQRGAPPKSVAHEQAYHLAG